MTEPDQPAPVDRVLVAPVMLLYGIRYGLGRSTGAADDAAVATIVHAETIRAHGWADGLARDIELELRLDESRTGLAAWPAETRERWGRALAALRAS